MRARKADCFVAVATVCTAAALLQGAQPVRAKKSLVISASQQASEIGGRALRDGGNAIDAAVATAFALAVTHPAAGNIGGGGFLLYRAESGDTDAYDFREMAPSGSSPTMFLSNGQYDAVRHHQGYGAAGVPGTVAGLHLAWSVRRTIDATRSSTSTPTSFSWPAAGSDTTHISIVDDRRNAVALTYTLEESYGSGIVVPGAGFLLNTRQRRSSSINESITRSPITPIADHPDRRSPDFPPLNLFHHPQDVAAQDLLDVGL